ncbi:hypothetical protein N9K66_07535 [Planktomarina temperata]|nr:hypothetical protein [Planktomarina temperata]
MITFKSYKKLNFVFAFTVMISASASAQQLSFKILDSGINEFAAYVSSLTGNTYLLDFTSSKTISIVRNDFNKKEDIHSLLVKTVEELGGVVNEISTQTYEIVHQSKIDPKIESTVVQGVSRSIARLNLEQKISVSGVKNLINSDERFVSIKIIEENLNTNTILISGNPISLSLFTELLNTLENYVNPQTENEILKPVAENSLVLAQPKFTAKVFDLNYADAIEITESLKILVQSLDSEVSLSAHESSNQIVLSGPENSVEIISKLVEDLDRAPRQVYLDAIIAEVSEETAAKLGLQFSVNSNNISASSVTGVSGVNIGTAASDAFLAGAAGGVLALGRGTNLVPDIGVMLTALQGNTDNRILATPSLMASENKESIILVGQNVPFITGQFTNEGTNGSGPFQTIQRQDLGTSLKLKPKVGANGTIIMEIWQETSRIDQSTPGLSDIVTVKRQISTVVSANDGETIAIGGLKIEQQEIGVSKVPILGDLPLIGKAFRQEVTNSVSRNLVVFLRPTLVSTQKARRKVYDSWEKDISLKMLDNNNNQSEYFDKKSIATNKINGLKPVARPWK